VGSSSEEQVEPLAIESAASPAEQATPAEEPSQRVSSHERSKPELRRAVRRYSDAFLNGDAIEAYSMFSARCKERTSLSYFTGVVTAAEDLYGAALTIETYRAKVSGDFARVSYTFPVPALNQTQEPWVRERGKWRQDDC
jgi:hypothetical protein